MIDINPWIGLAFTESLLMLLFVVAIYRFLKG